jgi:hypothetical protein
MKWEKRRAVHTAQRVGQAGELGRRRNVALECFNGVTDLAVLSGGAGRGDAKPLRAMTSSNRPTDRLLEFRHTVPIMTPKIFPTPEGLK